MAIPATSGSASRFQLGMLDLGAVFMTRVIWIELKS
jgi:hypothetical protein